MSLIYFAFFDLRRSNYNVSDYLVEWGEFLKALKGRAGFGSAPGRAVHRQ